MVSWAINIVGDKPNDVIKFFEEVFNIIQSSNYEEEATIDFYELITNVSIKTDKKPIELLNKNSNLDLKYLAYNGKLNVLGVRIGNKISKVEKDFTQIVIEPKPTSPNNRILIRVVFRSSKKEKVYAFHGSLNTRINNFLKQF